MTNGNQVDGEGPEFFENQWLTTKEIAGVLRLSENAVRIMVHRNQVRSYKLGRRLRFRHEDCQVLFKKKGA